MSPILFAIFLNELGKQLNGTCHGIKIGAIIICAILFADDLVIIGKNRKALEKLMLIVQKYFKSHQLCISEPKSKIVSFDASTGKEIFIGSAGTAPVELEKVLSFKYLGIPLNVSPYCLFRDFNDLVKRKAKNYLHSVLSISRNGPDRSELARTLWLNCALPSILYGSEIIPITQDTINKIEKCQSQIGKFMLQIPRSSANICSNIDAGLKPIKFTD